MLALYRLIVMMFLLYYQTALAAESSSNNAAPLDEGPVEQRQQQEKKIPAHYFAIAFYKPTYILPYYYTGSPDDSVYQNNTPNDEQLKHAEVKYQLSFKVPVWKNILHHPVSLYLAYTQLSYWQVYNHDPFFRETDYEPELFLTDEMNFRLFDKVYLNFLNLGAVHQSNGYGGSLERSWNRVYLEAISSVGNWMISLKPWYILHDSATSNHNPDIANYLGYGQILVAYKHQNQVFSLTLQNVFESQFRKPITMLTWSFPLTSYIKGYVQVFSGYGQSLIEYNHHTNSAGVGIALSDWV